MHDVACQNIFSLTRIVYKVTLRHLQALFVEKSKFVKSAQRPVAQRQLFRAAKHSSILCDRESSICFFLDEASKF